MNREHAEQVKIFSWAKWKKNQYPELALMYAIPNANKRSIKAAMYMKAEGLKAGMPDICLPVARGGYSALYIELKVGKNRPNDNQKIFLNLLNEHGNLALCIQGGDAAIGVIEAYLESNFHNVPKSELFLITALKPYPNIQKKK